MDADELATQLISNGWIELFDGQTITPVAGDKFFVRSGTINSTGQTGGYCWAESGGTVNSTGQTMWQGSAK